MRGWLFNSESLFCAVLYKIANGTNAEEHRISGLSVFAQKFVERAGVPPCYREQEMNDKPGVNENSSLSQATAVRPGARGDGGQLVLDETWLHDFYKECGREATLA